MVPRPNSVRVLSRITFVVLVVSGCLHAQTSRWTEERAKAWYGQQAWLVGSNYIPDDAINELEMWQAQSFNPGQIDKELGWAEDLGMNTMRVFLHDLVWQENPEGFRKRIDQFLEIASRHHIKPLFVLFDSCWDPQPKLGVQHPPDPRRSQFRMGAVSRECGPLRSGARGTAQGLRRGSGWSICQRRARARLGRME